MIGTTDDVAWGLWQKWQDDIMEAILTAESAGNGCGKRIGPFSCCSVVQGDCLELMKQLPDGCVVITDPPYNIGFGYDQCKDSLSDEEYGKLLRTVCPVPCVMIHYPEDMFSVSGALGKLPDKCASWTYNAHTSRKWRMIAWFGIEPDFSLVKQPFKNPLDRRLLAKYERGENGCNSYDWWHVEQVKNVSEEKTEHPCQIPTELMEYVVGVTPCITVLDPFTGSGTTLVAAKKLGRHFLGFEISADYVAIARRRLDEIDAQPNLFAPKPEQLEFGQ